jgi:hypothetical protein
VIREWSIVVSIASLDGQVDLLHPSPRSQMLLWTQSVVCAGEASGVGWMPSATVVALANGVHYAEGFMKVDAPANPHDRRLQIGVIRSVDERLKDSLQT